MTSFSLRPASEHDENFIFETFELAMRQYVEWAWGWDERTQRGSFLEALPIRNFKLICVNGEAVGAIAVEESPQRHWIRTLFLRPAFQGLGIGSAVLAQEADRARRASRPLVLRVIKINPAKRLYDRLGFKVIGEDDTTYHMRLD